MFVVESVSCSLRDACWLLIVACCVVSSFFVLSVVCESLRVVFHLLSVVCWLLFVGWRSLFCCLMFNVVVCRSFVVYCFFCW